MTYKVNCYKTYLGDGVYAELSDVEPGGVWLTTSDGTLSDGDIQDTNAIYLEPQVLAMLLKYIECIPAMEQDRAVAHVEMIEDRRWEGYNEQ